MTSVMIHVASVAKPCQSIWPRAAHAIPYTNTTANAAGLAVSTPNAVSHRRIVSMQLNPAQGPAFQGPPATSNGCAYRPAMTQNRPLHYDTSWPASGSMANGGTMQRREFITLIGGATVWPLAARAQQAPVVGWMSGRSPADSSHLLAAFREGLSETGFVEGQTVSIEYRWAHGEYDRLP